MPKGWFYWLLGALLLLTMVPIWWHVPPSLRCGVGPRLLRTGAVPLPALIVLVLSRLLGRSQWLALLGVPLGLSSALCEHLSLFGTEPLITSLDHLPLRLLLTGDGNLTGLCLLGLVLTWLTLVVTGPSSAFGAADVGVTTVFAILSAMYFVLPVGLKSSALVTAWVFAILLIRGPILDHRRFYLVPALLACVAHPISVLVGR